MGGRIIAGVIGFVVLVIIIQSYVLGDDGGPETPGRGGAAPTATLPAQTPVAISLGEVQPGGGTGSTGSAAAADTYVVKEGDTLGSIATGLNVPGEAQADWISEVLELNGMEDARQLQVGQELQVPAVPAAPGETPAGGTGATGSTGGIAVATATPEAGGGEGTYVVESGDTPLGIAEKLCVENAGSWVNELVALNGIDASNLAVGDELELPAGTPESC